MSRKKTQAKSKSKPRFSRFRVYVQKTNKFKLAVLGIIAVLLAYALVYYAAIRPIQEYNQKKEFDKAEAEITALANRIQEKIGRADSRDTEKGCSRPNMKSGEGDLSCSVSMYLYFENSDAASANNAMSEVSKLGDGEVYPNTGFAQEGKFRDSINVTGKQAFAQNADISSKLSCYINYSYATTRNADLDPNSLRIGIGCSGPALDEFYPLRN